MNTNIFKHPKTKRGFVAILTVIALLAFSASLMYATAYLSIDQSQAGLLVSQGEAALQLTNGCAEEALLNAKNDETYEGGTLEILGGTCEVTIEKEDVTWILTVTGEKAGYERTLVITLERTAGDPGTLTLVSWLEQ
jgi:hypothetical protein